MGRPSLRWALADSTSCKRCFDASTGVLVGWTPRWPDSSLQPSTADRGLEGQPVDVGLDAAQPAAQGLRTACRWPSQRPERRSIDGKKNLLLCGDPAWRVVELAERLDQGPDARAFAGDRSPRLDQPGWRLWLLGNNRPILGHALHCGLPRDLSMLASTEVARLVRELSIDTIHVVGAEPAICDPLAALPESCRLVLSFVDRDLHGRSGLYDYARQLQLVRRATTISVPYIEMRETLLAKFGRGLLPKVRVLPFGVPEGPREALQSGKPQTQAKSDLLLEDGDRRERPVGVLVGYRGLPSEQQQRAVSALSALPRRQKALFELLLPVEPTLPLDRRTGLAAAADRAALRYRICEPAKQLFDQAQIFVHLTESDGLGELWWEALLRGQTVIGGAWLPCGPLIRAGFDVISLGGFDELGEAIISALCRGAKEARPDPQQLAKPFSWSALMPRWRSLHQPTSSL
jgi:hypothetical protein